jgi:hypothetical protein
MELAPKLPMKESGWVGLELIGTQKTDRFMLALQGAGRVRKNLAGSLGVRPSSTGHQG